MIYIGKEAQAWQLLIDCYEDFVNKAIKKKFFSIVALHDAHKPLLSSNQEIMK